LERDFVTSMKRFAVSKGYDGGGLKGVLKSKKEKSSWGEAVPKRKRARTTLYTTKAPTPESEKGVLRHANRRYTVI